MSCLAGGVNWALRQIARTTCWFIGWRGGAAVGRRTCDQEVATREFDPRPIARLRNDSGQVVHTHVPMLPTNIIWYRRKLRRKQAHHTMH